MRRDHQIEFEDFAKVLQRSMDERGEIGSFPGHWWHCDEVDEIGVGVAGFVDLMVGNRITILFKVSLIYFVLCNILSDDFSGLYTKY